MHESRKINFPLIAWYAAAYDVELGHKLNGSVSALEAPCFLQPQHRRKLDVGAAFDGWLDCQRSARQASDTHPFNRLEGHCKHG